MSISGYRLAAPEAPDILDEEIGDVVPMVRTKTGTVRSDDDVRHRPERTLGIERLRVEDIEHRAAELTTLERTHHRARVHELRSADIDQNRARREQRKLRAGAQARPRW